jgi:lipoprotein-anchoring transpeptidase ErfK/SrfK
MNARRHQMLSRRLLAGAVAAGAAAALVAPLPASAATRPPVKTRWAHPKATAPVLSSPRAGAHETRRLHLRTEDGFREVYPVVATRGRTWVKVRIPVRPRPVTGWVRRSALGRIRVNRAAVVVDRGTLRATLFLAGEKVWSRRVGVGAPGTPTPAGRFWIREIFRVDGNPVYGPYAMGTSAYSVLSDWPGGGVVGLHGTDQPGLIPGRPSHGCVRLENGDVAWLATHVTVGTPVIVR